MSRVRNFLTLEGDADGALVTVDDHAETTKEITDPRTGQPKRVSTLELHVTSVDGAPADATLSVLSDKFYALWAPYLAGKTYRGKSFHVQLRGSGFQRQYSLEVRPG